MCLGDSIKEVPKKAKAILSLDYSEQAESPQHYFEHKWASITEGWHLEVYFYQMQCMKIMIIIQGGCLRFECLSLGLLLYRPCHAHLKCCQGTRKEWVQTLGSDKCWFLSTWWTGTNTLNRTRYNRVYTLNQTSISVSTSLLSYTKFA